MIPMESHPITNWVAPISSSLLKNFKDETITGEEQKVPEASKKLMVIKLLLCGHHFDQVVSVAWPLIIHSNSNDIHGLFTYKSHHLSCSNVHTLQTATMYTYIQISEDKTQISEDTHYAMNTALMMMKLP